MLRLPIREGLGHGAPNACGILYPRFKSSAIPAFSTHFLANSDQFEELSGKIAGSGAKWALAARALLASGQTETAVKLALKVWNDAAYDPEAAVLASEVLSHEVPSWHFKLARDHVRNAAFDAALRRAVTPGMRVLDIGSGTGLLAMMAARVGAGQVFSCEMNPAIADVAKDIITANGYSDRVHLLAKRSDKIDVDADLGGKVDIIVSEIVSNNLLSEGVLATMEHAVTNFLKPSGRVIPLKGTVMIALAYDPDLSDRRMAITDGFDLSAFNRLARPNYRVATLDARLQLKSDAVNLFEFDFQSNRSAPDARTQRTLGAHAGTVNCIAQWIHLQLDEINEYENRPGELKFSNWDIVVHPLPKQTILQAGDTITVNGSHDRDRVRIWASSE